MNSVEMGPLIDWPGLLAQFRGREASVLKVAATAVRTQESVPAKIRSLAASADFPNLSLAAHSIKGMAGNLMAARLFELARDVDQMARQEDPLAFSQCETLAQLMEQLLQELQGVITAGKVQG